MGLSQQTIRRSHVHHPTLSTFGIFGYNFVKRLARLALRAWLLEARESGVKMLEKFADTLEEYQEAALSTSTFCTYHTGE